MSVTVWGHTTDPTPKAAQYMASVLDSIGFKASVKTLDESVYWDTIATQKGDPQIAFQDWNQDFPEGQDFIDMLLNGEHIVNVGNNNSLEHRTSRRSTSMIDAAKEMPLGAARNAKWAKLDALVHEAGRGLGAVHEPRDPEVRVGARARARLQPELLRALPVDVAVAVVSAGPPYSPRAAAASGWP